MKKMMVVLILLITIVLIVGLTACSSKQETAEDIVNRYVQESRDAAKEEARSEYVSTSSLTYCKNVDYEKMEEYFIENGTESGSSYQITETTDKGVYSSKRVFEYDPINHEFYVQCTLITYNTVDSLQYQYTKITVYGGKIGSKISAINIAGQYKHYCINMNNYSDVYYTANLNYTINKWRGTDKVCLYEDASCSGTITSASNMTKARQWFDDSVKESCYNQIDSSISTGNTFLKKIDSSYAIASK